MSNTGCAVKRFPPMRRATTGLLEAASRKHMVHAILEVDVSLPRDLIRRYQATTGGGWGIPIATHTLNVTVGGIVNRPLVRPGGLEEREHLCLTVSFDHDIIDGAPAARFL